MMRWLPLLLCLGSCAAPPDGSSPDEDGGPFASSQIKPPAAGRGALAPMQRDTARRQQQDRYVLERQAGLTPDKETRLGLQGEALAAGVLDRRAGPMPHVVLRLARGQSVEAETRGLTPGADPVLHLWSDIDGEVARDDDGGQEPLAARLRFTASRAGRYLLLLRAFGARDDGVCDLLLNGSVHTRRLKFGGTEVAVKAGRTVHAVLLNDGQGDEPWPPSPRAALDTLLLLLERGTGRLLAVDDDSGVELGSELTLAADGVVALGAFSADDEGGARLVVNDRVTDSDGDGVGDGLEQALCLCHRADRVVCGFDCAGTETPQDSDDDGLSDGAELLGLDHPRFPQLMPRWGADPRHRDLFVEIDLAEWIDTDVTPTTHHTGRTLSTADAHAAARVFARLSGMNNPDGAPGIRLHLDLGHRCGALASGIDAVCGDLCAIGQDGQRRCGQSSFPGPPAARRDGLAPGRRHLFHVAVSDCLVAGQAPGGAADHLEFDCDRFTAMVHELGHNLGLARHYGTPETGGGNCKPNYPSLMNYAYSDRFDGSTEVQFSHGGAPDLDPRDLDETRPYGGDDADVSWLATRPFYFDLHQCTSPGIGCKVDWNRDGALDPSVQAFLSPMPNYGYICENLHANVLDTENIEGLSASSGPAAAELWRREPSALSAGGKPSGKLAPALHVVAPTTENGAGTLQLTYTFATAGHFQPWTPIAGPALRADAQPAAVVVPVAADRQELWIFACTPGPSPIQVATLDQEGALTALVPLPDQPASLRARDVSVTRVGTDLLLLVRDDSVDGGDRVYGSRYTPGGWTALAAVAVQGQPLRSTVTPAAAAGPDGRIYVVTGDPDPAPGSGPWGRLHLYSGDAADAELVDEELRGLRFEDGMPGLEHVLWSRPAMVFVPHQDGKGQPLSDGRGYLAIWWTRGTRTRHLWTWGQLSSQGAAFRLGRWQHYEAMGYTDAIAGSSVALALRHGGRLAALIGQADRFPRLVRHIPHADGIPDTDLVLRDFDDRVPIRQSMCRGLNWDCPGRCQRLSDPCGDEGQTSTLSEQLVPCGLPRWTGAGAP